MKPKDLMSLAEEAREASYSPYSKFAVGAALLGIMLFQESANIVRIGCIVLIVAGIVGLKLSTPA